jgi:hypothetical protein
MSRVSFVKWAYVKSFWTAEEALYARQGFVSAVAQGWTNADGSGQSITLVRFATRIGVTSAFDGVSSIFKEEPKPGAMLADPAAGAVGFVNPTLDSQGATEAEFVATVGDTMILVVETTAATPDPAAAKVLLQEQYDSLKNGS